MTPTQYRPADPLAQLGWKPVFQQQLSLEQLDTGYPVRVTARYQDHLYVRSADREWRESLHSTWRQYDQIDQPTTGDWCWYTPEASQPLTLLDRQNQLVRTAAGSEPKPQVIAANIDFLLIVTGCDRDFNRSRLERYLALAHSAGIDSVIVVTKTDLVTDPEPYLSAAQAIESTVPVIGVNATLADSLGPLTDMLKPGTTLGLVGSSGVGKTTLSNQLAGRTGEDAYRTQPTRASDRKGRHTTTHRQLIPAVSGAWLLDTPGMRELRIGDAAEGVDNVFQDLAELAGQCRFNDCNHQGDAGCALEKAIADGRIEAARVERYLKLLRESRIAQETPWEKRDRHRAFGKMARRVQREKNARLKE